MIRKLAFLAGAVAATAALALGPAAPAHAAGPVSDTAVPDTLGPGWSPIQLQAYSGNGCAGPQTDSHLSPIVSEACGTWTWYFRILRVSGGSAFELVDPSGTWAWGFSGSPLAAKLETPSTTGSNPSELILPDGPQYCWSSDSSYCVYFNPGGPDHIQPNGAGLAVQVLGSTPGLPSSAWRLVGP